MGFRVSDIVFGAYHSLWEAGEIFKGMCVYNGFYTRRSSRVSLKFGM